MYCNFLPRDGGMRRLSEEAERQAERQGSQTQSADDDDPEQQMIAPLV
jgi:hypothetical protein